MAFWSYLFGAWCPLLNRYTNCNKAIHLEWAFKSGGLLESESPLCASWRQKLLQWSSFQIYCSWFLWITSVRTERETLNLFAIYASSSTSTATLVSSITILWEIRLELSHSLRRCIFSFPGSVRNLISHVYVAMKISFKQPVFNSKPVCQDTPEFRFFDFPILLGSANILNIYFPSLLCWGENNFPSM